jgi:sulfatase modifying factor 1
VRLRSVLFVLLPCAGCSAFFDLAALGPGTSPPDTTDAATNDAIVDAGQDAASDAPDELEDSSAPCPVDAGSAMRRVGAYCIDTTEVTNAAYGHFLDGLDGGSPAVRHAACSEKTDWTPTESWTVLGTIPVRGVDWCDAFAYCASVGKRLCRRRGGGPLSLADTASADAAEWYRACSKAGTRVFPYGDELIGGECATGGQVRAVGQGCEGGYLGIFDMVGNAMEWIDACSGDAASDVCTLMGGSVLDPSARCSTTTGAQFSRMARNPVMGFRCCAD